MNIGSRVKLGKEIEILKNELGMLLSNLNINNFLEAQKLQENKAKELEKKRREAITLPFKGNITSHISSLNLRQVLPLIIIPKFPIRN